MTEQTFASVWDALEDSPEMAEYMKIRSALMMELQELVRSKGWAQEVAAGHLEVTQPRLNDLLRGRIDKRVMLGFLRHPNLRALQGTRKKGRAPELCVMTH